MGEPIVTRGGHHKWCLVILILRRKESRIRNESDCEFVPIDTRFDPTVGEYV